MKTFNKAISLLLCVIMTFSCLSIDCFAQEKEETTDFFYSLKYYTAQNDDYNIDKVLDKIDEMLGEKKFSATVNVNLYFIKIPIKIDLSSVNTICESIDKFGTLFDYGASVLRPVIGDLTDFNMDSWQKDMERGNQDSLIIKELLELLYNNKTLIRKLCDGTLDAGVFTESLDINKLVGEDGIGGVIKKFIIGLVYEKDSEEYNKAYEKYKNKIDSFIYGELLSKYAGEYLPGFTMNESSTVEDLICIAFGLVAEKYVKPIIANINVDTYFTDSETLKALDGIVNLNGSTYDFSGIKFDPAKSFLSQINNVVGEIFTQLIPGYRWKEGSYDKISENIEGAFKYIGRESGLIPGADSMTFDEIVMQVISVIATSVDLQGLGDGVTQCRTLEDMAKVALINLVRNLGFNVSYTDEDSYLLVMGDVASAVLYNWFDIKDLKGVSIMPGMGYDIFEVANFALNYLLFDKGLGSFLDFSTSKTEDVFTKADKLLDYFGETKSKGVNFDSRKFILGDGKTKGILDAVFALDIEYIIEITAVPALKNAGDVSAEKFLYNTVRNFLNNWSGKTLIPKYTKGAFHNALKNENVAFMAEVLIDTLYKRCASALKAVAFAGGVIFKGEDIVLGKVSAKVEDTDYTGIRVFPKASVSLGTRTLTQGKDFVAVSSNKSAGKAQAVIKGIGIYKGTSESLPFNIRITKVQDLKASVTGNTITLTWTDILGTAKYKVAFGATVQETKTNSFTLEAKLGQRHTFSVTAVGEDGSVSDPAVVTVTVLPEKVKGLASSDVTADSLKLSWNAVDEAKEYKVYICDGDIWNVFATTEDTYLDVNNLKTAVTYKFRVSAVVSDVEGDIESEVSDILQVTTKPPKTESLKATSVKAQKVKLTWQKVSGATEYQVHCIKDGKEQRLYTVSTNSCTLSSLAAATEYIFRVRAVVADNIFGEFSDSVTVKTLPSKVTGIKTDSVTTNSIKLTWKKIASATHYVVYIYRNGQWERYPMTTKNYMTVKELKSGKEYKFKVRAYNSKTGTYSEDSIFYVEKTLVAKVKGLKTTAVKATSVKVAWNKVTGAAGYTVYYSTDKKAWKKAGNVKGTTLTVSKLKSKKTYYFKVRAYSSKDGNKTYGAYSSVIKAKTK